MKGHVPIICDIISAILLIVFVIKSIVGYTQYSITENSAPFSVWILADVLYFIIPAIIVFVIGIVVKKKQ